MANADWDLGQKLIEKGLCTLDQVREVLSLQDRMRKTGAVPKPFARVVLEKGYATRDQLLRAGVAEKDLPAPVEEKPRVRRPPASVRASASGARTLAIVVLVLGAVGGLIVYARGGFGPSPGPEKSRTVETPVPPAEERDAALQAQLDQIGAFALTSSNFENAPDVVARYELFKKAQAGNRWEIEAHRRLKEYRERADVFAKAELDDLRGRESDLRAQERWGELLALYRKFPAKFLETTETGRGVREKLQELTQRIREIYLRDKAEVEKLSQAGKFEEALARVKSMEVSAPPEQLEEIGGLRGRIERESRGVAEKNRQQVADLYFKVDDAFKTAMKRRDGFRAAAAVREFLIAPWKDEQRPFVFVRGVDYEAVYKLFEPWNPDKMVALCESAIPEVDSPARLGTGESALLALRNAALMGQFMRDQTAQFHAATASKEPLDLPTLGKGHFEKKDGRTVYIADTGAVLEPETSPLTDLDLAALAMKVGSGDAAMHARVGFFHFYASPDLAKEAYEHLAKAAALGARGVKLYLGGLAVAAESELRRLLETKFGAAKDLYQSHQWPQVKKLLGEVLEYPDHEFTKSVRPEIEKMLFEIAEGSERERKLVVQCMAKKVESVDAATVRVTYDFETKEQADAFELLTEEGGRKFKGRWRADRGGLESSPEASVMRWKPAVKGDVTVEYDLTPMDEPQNIVLDLYYNRGQSRHYAVVLGFDWVGKQDGDRDNSVEDKFEMPRTCVIKYPVAVDKSRWVLADTWNGWKSRLAGKAVAAWKPAKGKAVRLRVERQGRAIRLLADRTLIWEGDDGDYGEGSLLFYSDCRCRIDNLVITFRPQT